MTAEKMKKWLRWLGTALCLLVLCVNLITLCLNALGQEQLPYGMLSVESGSMAPAIPKGALVLIREVPYNELQIGDDVTFITTDGFVTHRIVGTSGESFVTKGIANAMEDPLPMGPESYCGKVMLALPVAGWLIQRMTATPVTAVLTAVLVMLAGLLHPVLAQRFDRGAFQKSRRISWVHRGTACAGLLSLMLCVPMTEAKYVAKVNMFEVAVAQPMYFSSNYLSEGDGNTYSIQGWNGKTYTLTLTINNFDNSLLYNDEQMNLLYGVGIKVLEDGDSHYQVTLERKGNQGQQQPRPGGFVYPQSWDDSVGERKNGKIIGGNKYSDQYLITISPKDSVYTPQPGEVVKFQILACTSPVNTYFRELTGTFQLKVAAQTDFLGTTTLENKGSMVGISVTTNLISGEGTDGQRLVKFKWDPDKLYLNVYERTAYNAIYKQGSTHNKDAGELYMRLQAYSKVELEFFKKSNFVAKDGDIEVTVVGETAEETTEETTEQTTTETTTEQEDTGENGAVPPESPTP